MIRHAFRPGLSLIKGLAFPRNTPLIHPSLKVGTEDNSIELSHVLVIGNREVEVEEEAEGQNLELAFRFTIVTGSPRGVA